MASAAVLTRGSGDEEDKELLARRYPKIITLCRLASLIHFELLLTPSKVVDRMQQHTFELPKPKSTTKFISIFLALLVAFAPYLYANYYMYYPCEKDTVVWDGKGQHTLARTGCEAEDDLRRIGLEHHSPWITGGAMGFAAVLQAVILTICQGAFSMILIRAGLHRTKRLSWKPLLMLWYYWMDVKVPNLKYVNSENIFWYVYSPPSVLLCWLYTCIFVNMIYIGYTLGNTALGALSAFVMGEFLVRATDFLVNQLECTYISAIQGHLNCWRPHAWSRSGLKTVLHTLQDHLDKRAYVLSVTEDELYQLVDLAQLCDPPQRHSLYADRTYQDDDGSDDSIGFLTDVYLLRRKEHVGGGVRYVSRLLDIVNKTVDAYAENIAGPFDLVRVADLHH
eukprot:TRINITY_DN73419_c0_g1_i1.p1 TRINITY_DN73419_c0_g1~~TRINITY_DN73419_c0_g1_i1.p1  ORF type:complete len:394 (+),score=29.91 TRINITY_DN73419_c0_g1_i1:154-1335(+)